MALYPVDRKNFDRNAQWAESTRQTAMRGVADQTVADGIHCQYFLEVINAGTAFNITVINERTAFQTLACSTRFGLVLGDKFILGKSEVGGPDVLAPGAFVVDYSTLDDSYVLG